MNSPFVVRITVTLASCCLFVIAALAEEPPHAAKIWPYQQMNWKKDKTLASVQTAPLWGDPATGEHGMLRRFPAGYAPPAHKHPSVERVVVISGTIMVRYAGSAETTLGPGSYSEIPAGTEHAVKCGKESECVFLLASSGPFAIIPTTAPHQH